VLSGATIMRAISRRFVPVVSTDFNAETRFTVPHSARAQLRQRHSTIIAGPDGRAGVLGVYRPSPRLRLGLSFLAAVANLVAGVISANWSSATS
jgi:hypothetical protein